MEVVSMITWGFVVTYSDIATNDAYFVTAGLTLTASYIYCQADGDIVWENANGQAQFIQGAIAGMLYPVGAARILSSGTVNGMSRTTTATGIVWLAGNKAV
jgi:glucose uptake protein GlcU